MATAVDILAKPYLLQQTVTVSVWRGVAVLQASLWTTSATAYQSLPVLVTEETLSMKRALLTSVQIPMKSALAKMLSGVVMLLQDQRNQNGQQS